MGTTVTEKKRRQHSSEQKVAILREVLVEKKPVSDVCEAHKLQPSLFYYWQKQFFENGTAAFERDGSADKRVLERTVAALTGKLAKKDAVIAEVTEEFVKLKKELGDL
jgi:transposase-like protein